MPDANAATAADLKPAGTGTLYHSDPTAKWFLISAISYFFIVGIIALTIAAKFCWPELLGTVPYLSYGRLRPLHVNGMLFGWLLAADMGLAYYIVPRLCGVKLYSEKTRHRHRRLVERAYSGPRRRPQRRFPSHPQLS